MVVKFKDLEKPLLDRVKLSKLETYLDDLLLSPKRRQVHTEFGHNGRELIIDSPYPLNEEERIYICQLYRSFGWHSIECETTYKKQTLVFNLESKK